MAKGYIIEEVHVTGGSIRLRDSLTGKVVDVPLTPGSKLTLSEEGADDADAEESATDDDDADAAEEEEEAADDADAKPAARRRRRRKARAKKAAAERDANAEDVPGLTVPRSRPVTEDPTPVVDESTLSDEDKAAVEQFRTLMSKRGKRGGLGWKEITVEGRSGLQARWGKGQFKILHTGGDSHALFYEWDGGKFERIACGKADDLMRLAAARSEDEQPKAPLTTLTLEVARMFCGTPDQQDVAKTRLRPVRNAVQPEPEALHSHDNPRLNIRYSLAGETTSGPLVNVTLQFQTGASKHSLFQLDGVQLHNAKSQPQDVLKALFQEVIDLDDTKQLRRLGKFLDPALPSEKFKELTESEEPNDDLAEDLVSALSASGVTFDDAGAARAPRRATAERSKDAPHPPADEASENEAKDQELISSFGDELAKVLAEEDD